MLAREVGVSMRPSRARIDGLLSCQANDSAVARPAGFRFLRDAILGLTPQALC
jgi:hypothetical protein